MTGEQLKTVQEHYGWTGKQLADVLAEAVGRKVSTSAVSSWRTGAQRVPADVAAFLESLVDEDLTATAVPEPEGGAPAGEDEGPRRTAARGGPPPIVSASGYATICTQFFELIGTAVGMIGAAVGSDTVRRDGLIINEDKHELGRAWGKLAETNETFRNMLLATDKQGAYLAIALATGTTVSKIWRNHQPIELAPQTAAEALRVVPGEPGAASAS